MDIRKLEVIKFDGDDDTVVYKFPTEDINMFSQLVVNEAQEAVFYKEGKALDVFGPGTHTLKTGNIPLIEKYLNIPFGGKTPFPAEVFFVKKSIIKRKWGTQTPIPVEDPKYKIMIELRAHGAYNIRINDSKTFLVQLAGQRKNFAGNDIDEIFRPMIITRLSDFIAEVVLKNNIPIVQIAQFLDETASAGKTKVQSDFPKYGVEIIDFLVESINFDKNDPNFQRIQKVLSDKFEIDTLGAAYQQKRMLDIGEAAAKNEGSQSGGAMGAGMGIGMGVSMGQMMGGMMGQMGQPGAAGSPGAAANPNDPAAKLAKLKQMLDQGLINNDEFEAKKKEILAQM